MISALKYCCSKVRGKNCYGRPGDKVGTTLRCWRSWGAQVYAATHILVAFPHSQALHGCESRSGGVYWHRQHIHEKNARAGGLRGSLRCKVVAASSCRAPRVLWYFFRDLLSRASHWVPQFVVEGKRGEHK